MRELSVNIVTFTKDTSFVKAARFIDYYCIADETIWINMEQYVIKKEDIFKPSTLVQILESFSAQQEGSRDFYDFCELKFNVDKLKEVSTSELVSIAYSFY